MLKHLSAVAVCLVASSAAASALPLQAPVAASQAPVVLVSGGCGFAFHRNPFGACVPNGGFYGPGPGRLPPPCPRGYYRDPDPARPLCYPRY